MPAKIDKDKLPPVPEEEIASPASEKKLPDFKKFKDIDFISRSSTYGYRLE